MDPNEMTQEDIDMLMQEELGDLPLINRNIPKYSNNSQIPNEYLQDYQNEYDRLSQPDNYDPLLMYILQKNAQSGFKTGPIGSDSYYETYDPELDEDIDLEY